MSERERERERCILKLCEFSPLFQQVVSIENRS